jgi:hypothetical protein
MQESNRFSQAVLDAVAHLLRPLFRFLVRSGMSFSAFEEVAKRTYVDVAIRDFGIPGKKPSVARASILSGLTRKEVQRLLATPFGADTAVLERHNRAARVLTGWVRDADFHNADGTPQSLHAEGPGSFDALVRRHSGDMPTRAILDELVRVGAVYSRPDGRLDLLTRAYVPQQGAVEKVDMLGTDVADLITTIDHNIRHGAQDPRFQRKVMYHAIPAASLPAFRQLSATQAQALLEGLDAWLAAHDTGAPNPSPDAPAARVGVGVYYFEEALESTPSETKT